MLLACGHSGKRYYLSLKASTETTINDDSNYTDLTQVVSLYVR